MGKTDCSSQSAVFPPENVSSGQCYLPAKIVQPRTCIDSDYDARDISWVGSADSKELPSTGQIIYLYKKFSIDRQSFCEGDIVKLARVNTYGEIVYMFEDSYGVKWIEIRDFEKTRKVLTETFKYERIPIKEIKYKFNVDNLQFRQVTESGCSMKMTSDAQMRFIRARERSKLYMELNSSTNRHSNAIASLTLKSIPS
jgi:hypothetical protein